MHDEFHVCLRIRSCVTPCKMAWDFKIKFTKLLWLGPLILLLVLSNNISSSSAIDCGPVKKCECSNNEQEGSEVLCPRYPAEEDVQIQVIPNPMTDDKTSFLRIICKVSDRSPWTSVQGLSFSNTSYTITKVRFNYCPASTPNNTNMLKDFLDSINLPLEPINTFSFISTTKYKTAFPPDMLKHLKNLESLELEKLNLQQIPDLSHLKSLKQLILRNNEISTLSESTFASNSKLTSLDLSQNKIQKLEPNVLPKSLTMLSLANNTLHSINNRTFSTLENLQYLTLTWNPLTTMEPNSFANLKNLISIQIDSSEFDNFPKFEGLENLEEISISYRDRTHLPQETRSVITKRTEPVAMSLKRTETETVTEAEISTKSIITPTSPMIIHPSPLPMASEFEGQIRDMPRLSRLVLTKDGLAGFPRLYNLPNLTYINLQGNNIKVLPVDALKGTPNLEYLDLSNNEIATLNDIQAPKLKSLILNNNQLTTLGETVFSSLKILEKLLINNNKISVLHPRVFASQAKLITLDMSRNALEFDVPIVNRLVVHEDDLFGFSDFFEDQSPLRFCSRLKRLDLSHNLIQYIHNDWKAIFGDLELLNLNYNNFSRLHATDLTFVAQNLKLLLTNNRISEINMRDAQLFLEGKIITIDIDSNPLNCDCNILAFKKFNVDGVSFKYSNQLRCQTPPWLKDVEFKNVNPTDLQCSFDSEQGCPSVCNCWKIPANYTISVDCSNRNLTPSEIPSLATFDKCNFGRSRCFITFNLSGNKIDALNATHVKNFTPNVQKVDLTRNDLSSISFMPLLQNNDTQFYLSNNNFSCRDCDFHKTLRTQFKRVPDYTNVSCVLEEETYEDSSHRLVRYFVDEFPEDQICIQNNSLAGEVQALIIAFSIILFLLVIFIGFYIRYGWAIRAFLYSKGLGCCFMVRDEDDTEKIYDAFVSYSHKDEDWVLSQLVPRLEDQEGFKLCLHFRDWTPGDWIPDQIVRSVDQSRRTVIILSKHFVQSIWSTLEFKAAHTQAITEKTNRLILVLMDDELREEDIQDDDLRVYMKMNTYLKYNDPWFWHKLKYALPHTKSQTVEDNFKKQQQRDRAIQLDKLRTKLENSLA